MKTKTPRLKIAMVTGRRPRLLLLAALLAVAGTLSGLQASGQALPFSWSSLPAGSGDFGVYDYDGVTPLLAGDVVQLIWTGDDKEIDAPGAVFAPGGDDELLDSTTVEAGGTLPKPLQGHGYIPQRVLTLDAQSPVGGKVYLRAWNARAAGRPTAYGDSATVELSAGGDFNAPRWNTAVNLLIVHYYLPLLVR